MNLGEIYSMIKLKRVGDDNVMISQGNLISWERNDFIEKRTTTIINLKELMKNQRTNQFAFPHLVNIAKDDKTKQMKAFVSNLMSKKNIRKVVERNEENMKVFPKKNGVLQKNKTTTLQDELQNEESRLCKPNLLSATNNGSSVLSVLRSYRKDIIDRNRLKDSKFTGNSQKETSVGDQSIFFNQRTNPHITQMSNENENYSRMKMKFDSQPYFYQNSTITSQFSHQNDQNSTRNQNFLSREDLPRRGLSMNSTQNIVECLKNKSEHESQEEVEEQIVRNAMQNSSVVKEEDEFGSNKSKIRDQSSQCFQSKHVQSSQGTIYESKYQ